MIWAINSHGSPTFSFSETQMLHLQQTFWGNVFENKQRSFTETNLPAFH